MARTCIRSRNDRPLHAAAFEPAARYAWTAGQDYLVNGLPYPVVMEHLPHFAGSFFFKPFFDQIDAGSAVRAAWNAARNTIPMAFGPLAGLTVRAIQRPRLQDTAGDAGRWSFVR